MEEEVLEIENFGPISKAKINLKKYIVLIGPQSSGKSTIAKLIALFRSFSLFEHRKEHDLERQLYDLGMKNYLMPTTKIIYKSTTYSFTYSGKKSSIKFANEKTADFIKHEYPFFLRDRLDLKERRHFLRMIQHDFHREGFKIDLSYYIPAERVIVSLIAEKSFSFFRYQKELKLPIVVSDFGIQYQAALDEEYYRKKPHSINKLKTLSNSKIHLSIENNLPKINVAHGPMLDLAESSSGVQSLIPLLLVADYIFNENDEYGIKDNDNVIRNTLIVEEPEQNLFPQTQKELIYDLVAMCTSTSEKHHFVNENQLVICTHSPYTLSCFNNLLMAGQKIEKNKKTVEKILGSEAYIDSTDFAAYYVKPSKNRLRGSIVESIIDEQTFLIGENALDNVSVPIMNEFEKLLDL